MQEQQFNREAEHFVSVTRDFCSVREGILARGGLPSACSLTNLAPFRSCVQK